MGPPLSMELSAARVGEGAHNGACGCARDGTGAERPGVMNATWAAAYKATVMRGLYARRAVCIGRE